MADDAERGAPTAATKRSGVRVQSIGSFDLFPRTLGAKGLHRALADLLVEESA
jgi:hypothetical protein